MAKCITPEEVERIIERIRARGIISLTAPMDWSEISSYMKTCPSCNIHRPSYSFKSGVCSVCRTDTRYTEPCSRCHQLIYKFFLYTIHEQKVCEKCFYELCGTKCQYCGREFKAGMSRPKQDDEGCWSCKDCFKVPCDNCGEITPNKKLYNLDLYGRVCEECYNEIVDLKCYDCGCLLQRTEYLTPKEVDGHWYCYRCFRSAEIPVEARFCYLCGERLHFPEKTIEYPKEYKWCCSCKGIADKFLLTKRIPKTDKEKLILNKIIAISMDKYV